mmetsp:Transcript_10389/g.42975  ORF Transcript_10389/g.42975 Transcript_10389/m.42975 type:complete len:326 (+) Transcript_10389:833-1810(+)
MSFSLSAAAASSRVTFLPFLPRRACCSCSMASASCFSFSAISRSMRSCSRLDASTCWRRASVSSCSRWVLMRSSSSAFSSSMARRSASSLRRSMSTLRRRASAFSRAHSAAHSRMVLALLCAWAGSLSGTIMPTAAARRLVTSASCARTEESSRRVAPKDSERLRWSMVTRRKPARTAFTTVFSTSAGVSVANGTTDSRLLMLIVEYTDDTCSSTRSRPRFSSAGLRVLRSISGTGNAADSSGLVVQRLSMSGAATLASLSGANVSSSALYTETASGEAAGRAPATTFSRSHSRVRSVVSFFTGVNERFSSADMRCFCSCSAASS